jgi:hypothetical protein
VYVAADGSRHFAGWRDTRLDLDCRFRRFQTDQDVFGYYCVPETWFAVIEQSLRYYADDACTVAAVNVDPCDGVVHPFRLSSLAPPGCDGFSLSALSSVGEASDGPYMREGDTCVRVAPGDEGQGWRATAPADMTTFVRAEMRAVDLGNELLLVRLRAEDGSTEVQQFSFAGTYCRPLELTPGGTRCVTDARIDDRGSTFVDASCTRSTGSPRTGCDGSYGIESRFDPNQICTTVATAWDFQPVESMEYALVGGVCQVREAYIRTRLELRPRDPATLPALELGQSGKGRLRSIVNRTEGGSTVTFAIIFDSVLGLECTPREFEDGVVRCIPTNFGSLEGDFDADCVTPAVTSYGCLQPPYYAEWTNTCHGAVRQMWGLGAGYLDLIWRMENGVCTSTLSDTRHRTLEPASNDLFAVLTEELE